MNLVYKTYEISTSIEYTAGTRLNLSGVRVIKLVNRPAGVKVWISTDSNKTNLFPLMDRGDGWVLPTDFDPIFDLYVYTEGINENDKLILSYTGEKDFFTFGSNSIGKVGEIENLGESAQVSMNDAIFNTYSRKPIENANVIYSDMYNAGIDFEEQGEFRYLSYILQHIDDLKLDDNEFYRLSIFGHIDIGDDNINNAQWEGAKSITSHITLFNNNLNATLTKNNKYTNISNLFQLDKRPYNYQNHFDIFGLKFEAVYGGSGDAFAYHNGATQLNYDLILLGKQIKRFASLGLFIHYTYSSSRNLTKPSLHTSLLITISQAIKHIDPSLIALFPAIIPVAPALASDSEISVYYNASVEIPLANILPTSTLNIQVLDTSKGSAVLKEFTNPQPNQQTNNVIIFTPAVNESTTASIKVSQTDDNSTSREFTFEVQIKPIPATPGLQAGGNAVSVPYGNPIEIPLANILPTSTLNIQVLDTSKGNAVLKADTNNVIIYTPAVNDNITTDVKVSQTNEGLTSKEFIINIQIKQVTPPSA